jgi:hypothetical protein
MRHRQVAEPGPDEDGADVPPKRERSAQARTLSGDRIFGENAVVMCGKWGLSMGDFTDGQYRWPLL